MFGFWVSHAGMTACPLANYAELNCTAKVTLPHLFVYVFLQHYSLGPLSSINFSATLLHPSFYD